MKNISIIILLAFSPILSAQTDTVKMNIPDSIRVEVMPEFPGGERAVMDFVSNNLKYPEAAKEMNIQGKVYVKFAVNTDGKVSDIQIVKGLSKECDNEVLRVIRLMPDWKPGTLNGIPVKTYYTLPVKFALN